MSSTAVRNVLVVYTEDHRNFPIVVRSLTDGGSAVTLLLPRWGRPSRLPEGKALDAEQAFDKPEKALADVDLVFLPSIPASLINLLGAQGEDAPLVRFLRAARRIGRPIVAMAEPGQTETLKRLGIAPITPAQLGTPEDALAELPSCDTCEKHSSCASRCSGRVQDLLVGGATRVGGGEGIKNPNRAMAKLIDHTLLKADATEEEVRKLCAEAREYNFMSVCVNPTWVKLSAHLLKGSSVKVCTVVGFPLGATDSATKVFEATEAIKNGATEVDMVINVGALKSKNYGLVEEDIRQVVAACPKGILSKVILETALLDDQEKIIACALAKSAGADFVKTSTGFSTGGATAKDIALMRLTVGPELGVKASGGVRDTKTAQELVAAGATRIGASASVAIVKGSAPSGSGY